MVWELILVVSLSLGSPSFWVLTWFWKGMEKVVPQPVCSSKGDQNLVAGVEDPDQVQGPVTCGWRVSRGLWGWGDCSLYSL